jgi:S1-C subfamily serine protease
VHVIVGSTLVLIQLDVSLSPSRSWAEDVKTPSLGLSLRVCNPTHALESVYHVLDVLEGSPAEMAGMYRYYCSVASVSLMKGLVPWGDFVLAWSGGPLHSENDFYQLVEAHVDKPLRLFVYNSDLE